MDWVFVGAILTAFGIAMALPGVWSMHKEKREGRLGEDCNRAVPIERIIEEVRQR